jgi:alanine racemase
VEPEDAVGLVDRIASVPGLRLTGIWSHLAAPGDLGRSEAQRDRFERAVEAVTARVTDPGHLSHLAASGGLLASSVPAYDRVRLGLGLYGLVPDGLKTAGPGSTAAAALRPVMSLRARPIRVADLPSGAGVSYGPTFETARPSRIATLPIGYGDGWPRSVSNRAEAIVRGVRVPLVGNVAMDAVMADVTDVPGRPVDLDDVFVLLGEAETGPGTASPITAGELAQVRTTISWEVVTVMARRLPRVYHAAAVPVGLRTLTEEVYPWLPESSSGTATSATSRSTRS